MLRLHHLSSNARRHAGGRAFSLGQLNNRAIPSLGNAGRSARSNGAVIRAPLRAIPLPPAHERATLIQTPLESIPEWLGSWGFAKHAHVGMLLRRLQSKVPGGFGGFTKGRSDGGKTSTTTSKAKDTKTAGSKDTKNASGNTDKTKVPKGSSGGGGGGGRKPKKEIKAEFGMGQIVATGAMSLFLLYSLLKDNNLSGHEINWQEFQSQLLASGEVERLVVTNKQLATVYMRRGSSAASPKVGGSSGSTTTTNKYGDTQDSSQTDSSYGSSSIGSSSSSSSTGTQSQQGGGSLIQSSTGDKQSTPAYYFDIGSIESFERKLEIAQRELGIASKDFVPVQYTQAVEWSSVAAGLAPTLLIVGAYFFFMNKMGGGGAGGGGGMSNMFKVGKSNAKVAGKDTKIDVTFKDVAGCEEAKTEIMEFVEFLKNPSRFKKLGAKIPKGALLWGPPGTGKTLLAKATAGEASVPFYSISGSDFIEMFVGVGPSRVRDLFATARENSPCIIFIDEIDAVARARSKGGFGGGNDERENTLNQLLVEMDGFASKEGVVVMAGTNRIDILDPAILRPGRFDRQIKVDLPDINGRKEIFLVHLKELNVQSSHEVVAKRVASLTPGFSGAQIANICNEAAILAARQDRDHVADEDFELAIDRIVGGLEKKNAVMSRHEKKTVAYHEAGHAVVGWFLEHADPLLKVTIIPRMNGALGFAQYLPKEIALMTKEQILDRISMALGGRAAEEIIFGVVTNGASDDLDKVTSMAHTMITRYGMNERLGQVAYKTDEGGFSSTRMYSENTAMIIDEEVKKMVDEAYVKTKLLLKEKHVELAAVAELLLEKETLTQKDIVGLVGPRPFEMPESYAEFLRGAYESSEETEAKQKKKTEEEKEGDAPVAVAPAV